MHTDYRAPSLRRVPSCTHDSHADGACLDLVAGDATVPLLIGSGFDDGDLEGARGRLGKGFGDVGSVCEPYLSVVAMASHS